MVGCKVTKDSTSKAWLSINGCTVCNAVHTRLPVRYVSEKEVSADGHFQGFWMD